MTFFRFSSQTKSEIILENLKEEGRQAGSNYQALMGS